MAQTLMQAVVELLRLAATDLPSDVEAALRRAHDAEVSDLARSVLAVTLDNIQIARRESRPMCQDTGVPMFFVTAAEGTSYQGLADCLAEAVAVATKSIPLRSNAVDPATGRNTGTGVGDGVPIIYYRGWQEEYTVIDLLLKGGGSENIGATYKLPDVALSAERDLEGVRRAVLDAIHKAQGRACPPYIIGVGVAGTKDDSAVLAKRQLLRPLGDSSESAALAALEKRLLAEVNSLGIGPSGLGGKTSAIAVKVGAHARHPATFFVDVSFACWAHRKRRLILRDGKASYE